MFRTPTAARTITSRGDADDRDRGGVLIGAAVLGLLLGLAAMFGLRLMVHTVEHSAGAAVGAVNVAQIEHAAQLDQVAHGTDAVTALRTAVTDCSCGVGIDTTGTVLIYRSGDALAYVNTVTGAVTSGPMVAGALPADTTPGHPFVIDVG